MNSQHDEHVIDWQWVRWFTRSERDKNKTEWSLTSRDFRRRSVCQDITQEGTQAWKQWKKENEMSEALNRERCKTVERLAKQTVERIHPNRFYFFRVTADSGPITVEVIPQEIWRQHLDDKKGDQNE